MLEKYVLTRQRYEQARKNSRPTAILARSSLEDIRQMGFDALSEAPENAGLYERWQLVAHAFPQRIPRQVRFRAAQAVNTETGSMAFLYLSAWTAINAVDGYIDRNPHFADTDKDRLLQYALEGLLNGARWNVRSGYYSAALNRAGNEAMDRYLKGAKKPQTPSAA